MELQETPRFSPFENINVDLKEANGSLGLTRLFKGVKPPQHEPGTLSVQAQNGSNTTYPSTVKIETMHGERQKYINGHRAIELPGQCYALPTMPIPPEHLNLWEQSIQDRLRDELAQLLRAERCHLEFCIVYDERRRIQPCILLSVWDEATCQHESGRKNTRRKVQKMIQKLQSMRDCRFPCKVVVDSILLLASLEEMRIPPGPAIQAPLGGTETTLVGLLIRRTGNEIHECTLGGLISAGQRIYGLTVAHPFSDTQRQEEMHSSLFIARSGVEPSDSNSSEDLGIDSSKADFASRSATESGVTEVVNNIRQSSLSSSENAPLRDFGRIYSTSLPFQNENESYRRSLDWALIELNSSTPLLQNSYVMPHASQSTSIESCGGEQLDFNLEIVVLGGKSGLRHGFIGQRNICLDVEDRRLDVTQVILNQPLGKIQSFITLAL